MGCAHTMEEMNKQWKKEFDAIETFYEWSFVKYSGFPTPKKKGDKPWSEIIAARFLEEGGVNRLAEIPLSGSKPYSRHYNIKEHLAPPPSADGTIPKDEKGAVKWMVGKKNLGVLGTALNYEAPLEDHLKRNIDLITARENELVLVEAKTVGNTESLLRAVLEIATYSYLVDKERLLEDFNVKGARITLAILVPPGSTPYRELNELAEGDSCREHLHELVESLKEKTRMNLEFYSFRPAAQNGTELDIRRVW